MSNQVNWDIAPKDATHHGFVNNQDIIAWYRYEVKGNVPLWSYWYSDNGILSGDKWTEMKVGQIPMQLPVTPRPTYTTPPVINEEWVVGSELPPIGSEGGEYSLLSKLYDQGYLSK